MRRYYGDDSESRMDRINTVPLWEVVNNYKMLLDYYEKHHYDNRPSDESLRARIKYILDNKIRQRDEIATLYWVLGETDEREEINL